MTAVFQWLIHIFIIIIPLLLSVAYLVYFERKVIAAMQLRKGPSVVGPLGLLQPIADSIKLLTKEIIFPVDAKKPLFFLAPILTMGVSLIGWAVIPFSIEKVYADINVGILYILAVSSFGVYGIIIAGWSSGSRYGFYGALRAASQMISYDICLGLIIVNVLLLVGSLNLTDIVLAQKNMWFIVPLFPIFIIFFVTILAETNRTPFDIPEAESEIVAGYHVEHSSMPFAMFFLAEYANIILMSTLTVILFLGGWLPLFSYGIFSYIPSICWFLLKIICVSFMFLWVRATFPRYRSDQLMRLCWKCFFPFVLGSIILTSSIITFGEL